MPQKFVHSIAIKNHAECYQIMSFKLKVEENVLFPGKQVKLSTICIHYLKKKNVPPNTNICPVETPQIPLFSHYACTLTFIQCSFMI